MIYLIWWIYANIFCCSVADELIHPPLGSRWFTWDTSESTSFPPLNVRGNHHQGLSFAEELIQQNTLPAKPTVHSLKICLLLQKDFSLGGRLVWRSVDYIFSGFAMNVFSCWLLGLPKHHVFGASSDGFIHLFLCCFKGDINIANPYKPCYFNGWDSLLSTHGWWFSKSFYLSPAVTGTCCPTRSSRSDFLLLLASLS